MPAPHPEPMAHLLKDSDFDRFWSKVAKGPPTDCWLWQANCGSGGYGAFKICGLNRKAHRVAFVMTYGEPEDGLVIDHLCRNRACVNPDHLEAITPAENIKRGEAHLVSQRRAMARTHCPHGHALTRQNTYIRPGGSRECRKCKRYAERARIGSDLPAGPWEVKRNVF